MPRTRCSYQAAAATRGLAVAEAQLASARSQLVSAQSAIPAAREALRKAEADLRRNQSLARQGYVAESAVESAVSAVAQARADWGLAIAPVAESYGLGFLPVRPERYDFAVPEARWDRPAVAAFRALLGSPDVRATLAALGFLIDDERGRE